MRIDDVALIEVEGLLEETEFWQEELVRPEAIYPDRFDRHRPEGGVQTPEGFRFTTYFLQLTSACGARGISGPLTAGVAHTIARNWVPLLTQSALVTPLRIWDEIYRRTPHGRLGEGMLVLSAIDLALWDLWGRIHQAPVVDLAGGAVRQRVPAYASMLGFTVTDFDKTAELAAGYKQQGFAGQKWFFRYGPAEGHEGLQRNLRLARTVREAVGEAYPVMFDAWQSMDVPYASALSAGLEEFHPAWLEEPLLPDQAEGLSRLRQRTALTIAGGEHLYTRWGYLPHLQHRLYDIVQPDLYWAGGYSETMRIAALAQSFDVQVMAHAHSANATVHFTLSQSPAVSPMQEHLIRWNLVHQHFLKHPAVPREGWFEKPELHGFGMELDLDRALSWRYLNPHSVTE